MIVDLAEGTFPDFWHALPQGGQPCESVLCINSELVGRCNAALGLAFGKIRDGYFLTFLQPTADGPAWATSPGKPDAAFVIMPGRREPLIIRPDFLESGFTKATT